MRPRESFGGELHFDGVSFSSSAFNPRLVVSLRIVNRSKNHKRHELSNQGLMPSEVARPFVQIGRAYELPDLSKIKSPL